MKESLSKLLDQKLLEEQEQRKTRERSGKFSPSSFGRCFRFQHWNRANEPQTNPSDERSLRVMSSGTIIHEWIRTKLLSNIMGLEFEKRIDTEDVMGFADIVSEDEVIDIKTEHSYAKDYRKADGYNILVDKKNNVLQIGWYALQLNKPFVRLVFIDRDNLLIDEYKIETSKIKEMVEEEVLELKSSWITATLPKGQPRCWGFDKKTGKPNECQRFCPFLNACIEKEHNEGRKHPTEKS